jgi:hypothetical protein
MHPLSSDLPSNVPENVFINTMKSPLCASDNPKTSVDQAAYANVSVSPLSVATNEDTRKLAETHKAMERRRKRAIAEEFAEKERRADDMDIFNNHVYQQNTNTFVVHERRTKMSSAKTEMEDSNAM